MQIPLFLQGFGVQYSFSITRKETSKLVYIYFQVLVAQNASVIKYMKMPYKRECLKQLELNSLRCRPIIQKTKGLLRIGLAIMSKFLGGPGVPVTPPPFVSFFEANNPATTGGENDMTIW